MYKPECLGFTAVNKSVEQDPNDLSITGHKPTSTRGSSLTALKVTLIVVRPLTNYKTLCL